MFRNMLYMQNNSSCMVFLDWVQWSSVESTFFPNAYNRLYLLLTVLSNSMFFRLWLPLRQYFFSFPNFEWNLHLFTSFGSWDYKPIIISTTSPMGSHTLPPLKMRLTWERPRRETGRERWKPSFNAGIHLVRLLWGLNGTTQVNHSFQYLFCSKTRPTVTSS